ncbi:MAG: asparagine synthase (glutamine-hydrolyzing) [Flavobacteriales bacterium]|nr:asparagine synthase (glutamine-hydrolyzing) [Flavobacteriales bacterium]
MCGINGFIDTRIGEEESRNILDDMLRATHHRGPDYTGTYHHRAVHLGHNRLSIIDLSDEANQPFFLDHLVMVYNGEIYNYLEIKKELEGLGVHFTTQSDTEVLLRSYQQWGPDCVQRFMGMWAFAIYDTEEERLFASRDRFGIKPFHYIHRGESFCFSSEFKALRRSPSFDTTVDQRQVALGLQLGMVYHQESTYWQSVKNLPGGHNLIFQKGSLKVWRYWDVTEFATDERSFEEKAEEFRELFLQSIRLHLRSDVPLGTCLSGGIDSSSIVSSVCHLYPEQELHTFSVYYDQEGYDERKWMQEVVKKYPQISPHYFSPSDAELDEHLEKFLSVQEVPIAGSSPFSQYFLMRLAKDCGVTVTLDGQGADEYLIGYMHAFPRIIADHLRKGRIGAAMSETQAHRKVSGMRQKGLIDLGMKTMASLLMDEPRLSELAMLRALPYLMKEDYKADEPGNAAQSRTYSQHHTLAFHSTLPTLLHYADRNSMAFSIESRVPFLDHRLVEAAFKMKVTDHVHQGVTKSVLRRSMRGIIPKAIEERKDKVAFKTPGDIRWLRGPLGHLLEPVDGLFDILDRSRTMGYLNEFQQGDDRYGKLIWRVAMLNHWLARQ